MINIEEAFNLIIEKKYLFKTEQKNILNCKNLILSKDVFAPISLPPFNNSAVDGFAVFSSSIANASKKKPVMLSVIGVMGAGEKKIFKKKNNDICLRIMTGALIDKFFDAVVMQEDVNCINNLAYFFKPAKKKQNIRFKGEDVNLGKKVLSKGTRIQSKHLGLLLSLGIERVDVYKKIKIAIISTGSELINQGNNLKNGEVYYCTGPMIKCVVENYGAEVVDLKKVEDDFGKIKFCVKNGLKYDVLVVIGGISVGMFDFVKRVFESLGVKEIFHKGSWRPGKPLFFGDFNGKPVFGLPGNPVAAYIIANVFIKKCLNKMQNVSNELMWEMNKLTHGFTKKAEVTQFMQSIVNEGKVSILPGQGSHKIATLAKSNAICWLEQGVTEIKKGTLVKTMLSS